LWQVYLKTIIKKIFFTKENFYLNKINWVIVFIARRIIFLCVFSQHNAIVLPFFLLADNKISHFSHPILDRYSQATVAATAANNKFIATDKVHKLIITSRQRISPLRVSVQTITDDLQHNDACSTDTGLLARLFARTCGLMRLRHRLHAYGYSHATARYNPLIPKIRA